MSKRLLVLLSLIISIVPFASVNAQTINEGIDYCAIMESDDCQILVNSTDAMMTVSSFAFDMSLNYDISIEGDAAGGMGDMNFGIDGNGMLAIDTEVMANIQNLAMTDMQAYMAQLPTLMDDLFTGIDGEAYLVVTLPDMFGQMVGTTEIPLNLLMKDGKYAVDVASLEQALGEEPSGMGWAGIDLTGAFSMMLGDMDFSAMVDAEAMEGMMFDMQALGEAMTITRVADSDVNGVPTSVFEIIVDYGALLDAMGMRETMSTMYTDMGMSPAEIEGMLSMLEGIQVNVVQYIGLDDFYTYRTEVNMDFAIDGETIGEPGMDSMSLGLDMTFDMNNFNAPVDIQLPEDAMIMPFAMVMGSGA